MKFKSLLKYLVPAILVGMAVTAAVNAQVASPNYFKKVGSNLLPITASTTIGSSSVNGAFKNLNVSGTCTGCGSGGGGVSTSTANTWSQPQTGAFIDKGGTVFNAMAYGLVGDGTTNDATAIQNTLNACTAGGGGVVQLPPGSIKVSNQITAKNNCIVNGMGKGVTTILGGITSGWTFLSNNVSSSPIVGFGITNLTINLQNATSGSAVQLNYASGTLLQNVSLANGAAGGWLLYEGVNTAASDTVSNYNNRIIDVDFTNHAGTLEAFLLFNAENTQIVRPTFTNITSTGIGLYQKDYDTHIESPYCSNM